MVSLGSQAAAASPSHMPRRGALPKVLMHVLFYVVIYQQSLHAHAGASGALLVLCLPHTPLCLRLHCKLSFANGPNLH